jgi:rhamnosyltransferase
MQETNNKQQNEIILSLKGNVQLNSKPNAMVFCHFDKDGIVDDYIVYYLEQMFKKANCAIIFVSNAENFKESEIQKIKKLTSQIIVRKNFGGDFEAYNVGYKFIKNINNFENIIFANDSVYGPLFDISECFKKMKNHDFWGITSSLKPVYHIQSYFFCFSKKSYKFLKDFWKNYTTEYSKDVIIEKYETQVSRNAMSAGLKVGAYIEHEDVLNFLKNQTEKDKIETELAEYQTKNIKPKELSLIQRILNKKKYRKNVLNTELYKHIQNPCFINWYGLIKYFKCPILKIRIVRELKLFHFHLYNYENAIAKYCKDYDINLIRNHLRRVKEEREIL